MLFFSRLSCVAFAGLLALAGCRSAPSTQPLGTPVSLQAPLGLPPVPIPSGNAPTAQSIALGRKLFYDKRLSVDGTLACSNCHNPHFDFTDGERLSKGVNGAVGLRNAPTVLNAAYLPFQFWDGRALSLEQQAASPIADPLEMNQTHKASVAKLAKDPEYPRLFKETFGTGDITIERVENALASFERTLLSGDSAFDRYEFNGDMSALTPAQVRGLAVFTNPTRGNCETCHSIGGRSALFTDGKFHNTGEGITSAGEFSDVGRYHETKMATDRGAFKTPTLRNIANTAPYMHDGGLKTLEAVMDFYAEGGHPNPNLDPAMRAIHLSAQDRSDLVEFMKALTGAPIPNSGPPGGKAPAPLSASR